MPGTLGVPLHAETEPQVWLLNGLDEPVMLGDGSDEQAACVRNALMMSGIDGYRHPHQARKQGALLSSDFVLGLDTIEAAVPLMPRSRVEVLVQMPAVHYAQELHPPAYAEEGYVSCHGLAD